MLRVLGRKDVVEHCALVEVAIGSIRIGAVEKLCELEHIVGVARFRSVDVVDIVDAGLLGREMLATAIATDGKRTLLRDNLPEILACVVPFCVAAEFGNALKSDHLWYLCVGMHVVEAVLMVLHRSEQLTVSETSGTVEIALVASHGIGIGNHLIHASVLISQHTFHLFVAQFRRDIDSPVAELQEELTGILVAAVEPCVAQSCIHLVKVVEWSPRAEILCEVARAEC